MAKTSYRLDTCNIEGSELHNKRQRQLSYVRADLTHLNESFNYTGRSLAAELKAIKADVKKKTGRALQKNAKPIKEGVAVIDEHTTMADLQEFCERCRTEFGIVPLQIHIHRDEGHVDKETKQWKPNLHAHVIWGMYNENGRNVRISNVDCARMQTLLAECLRMERGTPGGKKGLSALEYKIKAKEQELAELNEAKAAKEAAIEAAKEAAKEKVQDFFTGKSKAQENELKGEIQRLTAELASKDAEVVETKKKATKAVKQAENWARNDISVAWTSAREEIDHLKSEKEELKNTATTWQMIALDLWPEMLEAIKAIVERCTTTIRHFTDAGVEAIEKALARFRNREVAGEKLWGFAEKFFPEDTCPEWIEDGKAEYDNLIQGNIRQGQGMKR